MRRTPCSVTWPPRVSTTCLIGPDGLLYEYRKVHPWVPWEVHASPHDIAGAASAKHYPPLSWPGGSMVVDYDGRLLAQADAGPGEKIVVAAVDIAALRVERERRIGHHMLAHRRREADRLPASRHAAQYRANNAATATAKARLA